jgi:hypothetical protein
MALVYLGNKQSKIVAKIQDIKASISGKEKELSGTKNLFEAYTTNPSLGDSASLDQVFCRPRTHFVLK